MQATFWKTVFFFFLFHPQKCACLTGEEGEVMWYGIWGLWNLFLRLPVPFPIPLNHPWQFLDIRKTIFKTDHVLEASLCFSLSFILRWIDTEQFQAWESQWEQVTSCLSLLFVLFPSSCLLGPWKFSWGFSTGKVGLWEHLKSQEYKCTKKYVHKKHIYIASCPVYSKLALHRRLNSTSTGPMCLTIYLKGYIIDPRIHNMFRP